jgi:hypothetical protein
MNQSQVLYHWRRAIANALSFLSKPHVKVLAAFSLGVALARNCALHTVAEKLFSLGKADTVERRLQELLANPKLKWKKGCTDLSRWVLSSLSPLPKTFVLLVDEVALQQHLKVMVVALAYRGRAIPLAWWCYHQEKWPMGQVKLINTLLGWVAKALPEGATVLVETDRGIGTSPALVRALNKRHWFYLLRVQSSVRLCLEDGRTISFESVVSKPGQRWSQDVYAFKKAGWLQCRALAWWGPGYKEPWLLLTNYPAAQADDYGYRMWEELGFRDLKSSGFQWHRSRVRDPEHANRLWLVMALAYAWVVSFGTRVLQEAQLWREITRGKKQRQSVFLLGLRLLDRWFHLGKELWYELLLNQEPLLGEKLVP